MAKDVGDKQDAPSKAYRDALKATECTARDRTQQYRQLVVAALGVFAGSVIIALGQWSLQPLLLVIVLFPIFGVFLLLDLRLVAHWQGVVLGLWSEDRLELSAYCESARQLCTVPHRTLAGMLDTLPTGCCGAPRGGQPAPVRTALTALANGLYLCQRLRIGLAIAMQIITVGSVGFALARWSTAPLWGSLAVPALYGLRNVLIIRRFHRVRQSVARLVGEGPDLAAFREAAAGLDWSKVSTRQRRKIIGPVSSRARGNV